MVNLGLSNKTWVAFNIGELFEAKRPASRKEDDFDCGGVPFIASGGINNGVTKFCKLNGDILDRGNCLSISPVDGSCYYHPYDFLGRGGAGSSIILLYPKNFQLNRYVALFMSKAIAQTTAAKYSYGYMASLDRIKKDRIYLPVDDSAEIDFRFMTSFMKQKEQQILKPTIERLCKRLIENDILGGGNLLCAKWKPFYFTEIFTEIQRGRRLKKADHEEGKTPYVSSTSCNNGVDGFIGNKGGIRKFSDCLTLANSGSVGCAFYHNYTFVASDHVTKLKRSGVDKYAYLFMIPIVNRLAEKYSFNREINDERIKREKLLLPATDEGEIDFVFMSSFMKSVEQNILNTTLKVFKERVSLNESKMGGAISWSNFLLRDLFPTLVAGRSKGLNHIEKNDNGISYLGATNQNNGVLCFVSSDESVIQKGNCIAFIRNGEGSMGYSIYKAEDFIATSDMTLGYNSHLNKYNGTFITTIADRVRGKYNFGYKRSANRLAKEIITLPSKADGSPDWEYMEMYMRNIESAQILEYLHSISR